MGNEKYRAKDKKSTSQIKDSQWPIKTSQSKWNNKSTGSVYKPTVRLDITIQDNKRKASRFNSKTTQNKNEHILDPPLFQHVCD